MLTLLTFNRRTQASTESNSIHKSFEEDTEAEVQYESPEEKQVGVKAVEAAAAVGGWKIYVAWIGWVVCDQSKEDGMETMRIVGLGRNGGMISIS